MPSRISDMPIDSIFAVSCHSRYGGDVLVGVDGGLKPSAFGVNIRSLHTPSGSALVVVVSEPENGVKVS